MSIDAFEYANIVTCAKSILESIEYCRHDRTKLMASSVVGYLVNYIAENERESVLNEIIEIVKHGLENIKK